MEELLGARNVTEEEWEADRAKQLDKMIIAIGFRYVSGNMYEVGTTG